MLFKLSLKNITNSLRDYAIYLFTLVVAVAVFYVFNAVGGQAAATDLSRMGASAAKVLGDTLASLSIFVAVVLGLLIVYASRFLMKRRNREFALYSVFTQSAPSFCEAIGRGVNAWQCVQLFFLIFNIVFDDFSGFVAY